MNFAKWVFRLAGVYGLLMLLPQYFIEDQLGRDYPPAITHPEFFYGFTGLAVAWQLAFLIIGSDPARYRLLMLPAVVEKASFAIAVAILAMQNRVTGPILIFAAIDAALGILFAIAFVKTRPRYDILASS